MNMKKVPQLFAATGADKWGNNKQFPWTMGWQPSYRTEAQIYTKYMLQKLSNATLGILHQNDDFGKDYPASVKTYWVRNTTSWSSPRATRQPTRLSTVRSRNFRRPAQT